MYDYSGLFAIWTILTVGMFYSFLPAIRKFHSLRGLIALFWLVSTALSSIYLQDRFVIQVFYPWILPLLYLFPAFIEGHTNQIIGVPIFNRRDFPFIVMPFISALSVVVMFITDPSQYEDNIHNILALDILELELGLNSFLASMLFLSIFSMAHAVTALLKLVNVKTNYTSWVYLTWPWLEGIMAFGIMLYITMNMIEVRSGMLFQLIFGVVSIILFVYLLGLRRSEKARSEDNFIFFHLLHATKNSNIKEFLQITEHNSDLKLMADFTKENLSFLSQIQASEWDTYLIEVQMSWPVFKSHVRIQYAIKAIKDGYLEKFTLASLIGDLGYDSRSSFYKAFELVTKNPFDIRAYKN